MRNYKKLKAFQLSDELVLEIYKQTAYFPKEEIFGLTNQLRRAAVSTVSNVVEGASRNTEVDFLRFLDMAYGSACEVEYQVSLACRLGYLKGSMGQELAIKKFRCCKGLKWLDKIFTKEVLRSEDWGQGTVILPRGRNFV